MNEEKKNFKTWVKEHRGLLIGGAVVVAGVATYFGLRNLEIIDTFLESVQKVPHNSSQDLPTEVTVNTVKIVSDPIIPEVIPKILPEIVPEASTPVLLIPSVGTKFVRNLHEGWHASPEKIATAAENGFPDLLPSQTWVDNSPKILFMDQVG